MKIDELLDEPVQAVSSWSTGIPELDRATGGLRAGSFWVVVGTPGQGRSTLLTQLAVQLGMVERACTTLCSARDGLADVRARLVSLASGAVLPVPRESCRVDQNPEALLRLRAAPLEVDLTHEWGLHRGRDVLLVDDADVAGIHGAQLLRGLTSGGRLGVVASAARREAISGPRWGDPVDREWGEAADVVLEIDMLGADLPPHRASLKIHRNRYGPTREILLENLVYRARFLVDTSGASG